MPLTGWPAMSDDDGSGQSGTLGNKAMFDAMKASVEGSVFSGTNPAISPADIIDEVVDARGNKASLTGRLDVGIDLDGNLILPDTVPTIAEVGNGVGSVNLIQNDQFLIWPDGDAAAPAGWVLAGAGGTIARTGSGLGDTTRKHGLFAAKVTAALSVKTTLTQTLLDAAVVGNASFFNRKVSVGVKAKTTVASRVTISVADGVLETASSAHTGSGTGGPDADGWEWLSVTHTMSASATSLEVRLNINTGISVAAYWSGVIAVLSEIAPAVWHPALVHIEQHSDFITGNQTTGTVKGLFSSPRMGLLLDAELLVTTAPTGANLIVDVNTWDGAAYTTAFTTKPQIVAGAFRGNAPPDGTYARRCLSGSAGSSFGAGGAISFDIDQIGSIAAGANLSVNIRVLYYLTAVDALRAYDDVR